MKTDLPIKCFCMVASMVLSSAESDIRAESKSAVTCSLAALLAGSKLGGVSLSNFLFRLGSVSLKCDCPMLLPVVVSTVDLS